MKQIFSLFMVCCILGQASIRTAWVLHYQWNRAAYLRYCENRNKPELHCNGKCYLEKKIAGAEDGEGKTAPTLPDSFRSGKDLQLFFEYVAALPSYFPETLNTRELPPYQAACPNVALAAIFKPPAADGLSPMA